MIKKHQVKTQRSAIASLVAGVVIAIIVSILGALIGASLINNEIIPEEALFVITIFVWMVAALAASAACVILSAEANIPVILLINICYLIVIAGMGILFCESNFKGAVSALLSVIVGNIPFVFYVINHNGMKRRKIRYKI